MGEKRANEKKKVFLGKKKKKQQQQQQQQNQNLEQEQEKNNQQIKQIEKDAAATAAAQAESNKLIALLKEKEIEIEQLRMDAMKREEQTILTNQAMEAIQQEMSKTKEKNKVVSTQFMELETKLEVLKTERVKLLVDTEKAESSLKSSTELVSTLKKQKEGLIVEKEFWQEHGFSNINVAHVTLGRNDPMNPSSPMNNATNETKNDTTAIHFDNAKDQDLSKWQVGSGSDK